MACAAWAVGPASRGCAGGLSAQSRTPLPAVAYVWVLDGPAAGENVHLFEDGGRPERFGIRQASHGEPGEGPRGGGATTGYLVLLGGAIEPDAV